MSTTESSPTSGLRYRFGPFEADVSKGELRKFGLRIRLERKPWQLLLCLLRRPAEVVTRDELRTELWAENVFVDFDHGLNVAVKKLRAALCDSADVPEYIETIAGEGYRFLASVELARPTAATAVPPQSTPPSNGLPRMQDDPAALPIMGVPARAGTNSRGAPVLPIVALAALILVVVLAWLSLSELPGPRVTNYAQVSNDARSKISSVGYAAMATDGARLYYSEISTVFRLMQVSSGGGESVQVQCALPSVYLLDISPDRTQLLVQDQTAGVAEIPFWALPLVGGSLHRLGNILGHDGNWSPDGQRLAFAYQNELFLATRQGTEPRKLVSLPGIGRWIRWSPDGSKLRLTVDDTKTDSRSLWEVSADGTNLHPLLPSWGTPSDPVPGDAWPGGECCGNWTADGKYFFFQSTRGSHTDIWAIRQSGRLIHESESEPVRLTSGALNYHSPVPSREGRKIFVVGSQARGELQHFDAKARQFAPYLSGISVEGLDFSRDGQWITYVAYPEGSLWRSKVDGSDRLQLTRPPMRVFLPRWAPDGRQIAFAGKLPGKPYNIYLVASEDGNPEQLTNGKHDLADVAWSPDGKQLIFGEMTSDNDRAIHVLDLPTRRMSILPGSKGLFSPRWSPNGRYVAAIPGTRQDRVVLFDYRTKKWSELAKVLVGSPNWSRDSEYVYFDTGGNDPGFYRVRVSARKLERLASLKHLRLAPVWWTGLSPDGSPLILRDVGTEEIYALDVQLP